ncbi:MAG: PTS system mannose/fructose/sorbose family transporter subunit IID [Elusimicrobiales bacterium]|jgi:PTS system mannose-specific IID component
MNTQSGRDRVCGPAPAAGRFPLAAVFLRSFLIQAGWNYERFQNLGFAFAILPALRKIYRSGEAFNAAVLRHLGIFNTQPYMAGFVLGNVVRMEEELSGRPGDAEFESKLLGVKQALASGFAAIGDRVFWGRLKPLTTQLCIAVWLLAGFHGWLFTGAVFRPSVPVVFCGPLSGIVLCGVFAVYLRWVGLKKGYSCGGSANCGLDTMRWPVLIRALSVAGFAFSLLIVLGAFGLLIVHNLPGESAPGLAARLSLVLGVMALQRVARRLGRSIFFAMAIIVAVSVIVFTAADPVRFDVYL